MKKVIYILVITLITVTTGISQTQNQLTDSIVNELKKGVEGFKDRYKSPSVVLVIVHDKDIIFSEASGYIDVENKIPATINSKYPILSVTKTFTATMYMQLMERNLLALNDNVKKYVPEYQANSSQDGTNSITLLQLATHTSGLPRNSHADINFNKQIDQWLLTGREYLTIEPSTKHEFLKSLNGIQQEYPENKFLWYEDRYYSNLGYSILGIALERVAKTDYTDYIKSQIFKPLKMDNSGFDTENQNNNSLAKGYYYNDSIKNFIKTPVFKSNSALYAGGMYSTASDLAKFISFQFDTSEEANTVLSKENRAMMQTFKIGWKPSYPFVLHEGSMLGYRCQVAFNTELKLGWVILTNTSDFEFSKINEYISKLVLPAYNKKRSIDLNAYTGTYALADGYDSLNIYLKDGNLYSTYLQDSLPESPLTISDYNKFKGYGKGSHAIAYDFIADENSEIKALNMGQLMWVKQ